MEKYGYHFSFGPWNIHEGANPFGPTVRPTRTFADKLTVFQELGFDAVQFHDDDAVPGIDDLTPAQVGEHARAMRQQIADAGLTAEFVAPRLWENPKTIDGGFTANDPAIRAYALDRAKRSVDVAHELDTSLIVLWLAREGTYLREAKDPVRATQQIVEAIDTLLDYDPTIRVAIEPKPNEPMDHAYIPTMGHGLAIASLTHDPSRVGVLMESAHATLAGLDPSDEIGFALAFNKLYSVHLNDQNGLKYDQDRSFGSVDLRRAFNQVRVLDQHDYANTGMIGLDVKAIRTQPDDRATAHLANSLWTFLRLVEVSRSLDPQAIDDTIAARNYEALDRLILSALLGR